MRIEFQCTLEDFGEASGAQAQPDLKAGKGPSKWKTQILTALISIAVFGILFGFNMRRMLRPVAGLQPVGAHVENEESNPLPPTDHGGWRPVARFVITLIPISAMIGFIAVLSIASLRRPTYRRWEPTRISLRATLGWPVTVAVGVFGTILVVLYVWWLTGGGGDMAPSGYEVLLTFSGWVLALVLLVVSFRVNRSALMRSRWAAQESMQRPMSLDANEEGVTLDEPLSQHQLKWDYFPGYLETPQLILLFISPFAFWMVPKRAFASPGDLNTFKGMLLTHIKSGTLLPVKAGFDVIPMANIATGPQDALP